MAAIEEIDPDVLVGYLYHLHTVTNSSVCRRPLSYVANERRIAGRARTTAETLPTTVAQVRVSATAATSARDEGEPVD